VHVGGVGIELQSLLKLLDCLIQTARAHEGVGEVAVDCVV
jgi:hypothetical protein